MQPHEISTPRPKSSTNAMLRYAIALVLLVGIVGGIAWVVQYLPSRAKKAVSATSMTPGKKMFEFTPSPPLALWAGRKDP